MKSIVYHYPFQAQNRAEIHATMLDFRRFGEVHPVITEVRLIPAKAPSTVRYFVREKVKLWGWLPMKPQYCVDVTEPVPGKLICYKSRIMGIMNLQIDITLTDADASGNIELLESVQVSNIPLLTQVFLKVFAEAHEQAYRHLRRRLAGG